MIDDCPEVREVPASEILDKILRGEDVEYNYVNVTGILDLRKLDLPKQKNERTAHQKLLNLPEGNKLVKSKLRITNSKIDGILSFDNTIFQEAINFGGSQFNNIANFSGAQLSGDAVFSGAQFKGHAYFSGSQFSGDAYFSQAQFGGYAYFSGAQFGGYAYFSGAQFGGYAIFIGSQFVGDADFRTSQFSDDVDFRASQFRGDAIFIGSEFSKQLFLDRAKYEQLLISWESIKEHLVYDGATYLRLIRNSKELELFEDADACYYQYRMVCQSKKDWYKGPNRLIDLLILVHSRIISSSKWIMDLYVWLHKKPPFIWIHRFNWSKLGDYLSWISCGYGLKIWPMVIWITGTILIFAYVYNTYGGIAKDIGNISPIDSLYFSTFALFGRTPQDMHPIGPWRYVALIENLLVYVFLVFFVVVLGRKVVRQ